MKKILPRLTFLRTKPFFILAVLLFILLLMANNSFAQRDLLLKKDSTTIRCRVLDTKGNLYTYAFIDSNSKVVTAQILKSLVTSIRYNQYDTNLMTNILFPKPLAAAEAEAPPKAYLHTAGIGLNLGNVLEFNSANGRDKKSLSAAIAIDLGLNYFKKISRFAMTNELHWTFAIQKNGLSGGSYLQRVTDDLVTLHDFSVAMNRSNKWNFNLIGKTNTSIITVFDGSFFKDVNNKGKLQGFLNPYEVTLSPGIKFQPNKYFRFSISPYSIRLYGLTSQQIANTGFYTQTVDANKNYTLFVFKQLGAELNIWYDRKIKKWLEMQYRLGISSDYFSKFAKNGLMDGLFITKIKIIKNVYLSHRAIIKNNFANKPFRPYYTQIILLSYSKSF